MRKDIEITRDFSLRYMIFESNEPVAYSGLDNIPINLLIIPDTTMAVIESFIKEKDKKKFPILA